MQKERRSDYASGTRRSISVELVILQGNSLVDYKGGSLNFNSLTSCIEYLRKLASSCAVPTKMNPLQYINVEILRNVQKYVVYCIVLCQSQYKVSLWKNS